MLRMCWSVMSCTRSSYVSGQLAELMYISARKLAEWLEAVGAGDVENTIILVCCQ